MLNKNKAGRFGSLIFLVLNSFLVLGQESESIKNVDVLIDTTISYQVIDHFGASDAWSIQHLNQWPEEVKNEIADLLFSREKNTNGSPKGIGLSMWRINLGAGSKKQGRESGIRDSWRRASSIIDKNEKLQEEDFSGQLWFANAAKKRNVENFLLFLNSPPVWLTSNRLAYPTEKAKSNLPEENYNDFSKYIVSSIRAFKSLGIDIEYVSPFNEPQWDWAEGNQEGNPYKNAEIAAIVKDLNREFILQEIETKIELGEAGRIEYLFSEFDKPLRSDQIDDFFNPESENYLGDLKNLSSSISGHSYFTTSPNDKAVKKRKKLRKAIAEIEGLKFWMSEYCILGGNNGEIDGKGVDLEMNSALYISKAIHNDLVFAEASAWHWWLAVSPYDYKDGLIYIPKTMSGDDFQDSKMLWVLGNYSYFIRPGFQRVDLKISGMESQDSDVLGSAFTSLGEDKLVLVFINQSGFDYKLNIDINGFKSDKKGKAYVTNQRSNLKLVEMSDNNFSVPEKSVLTLVFDKEKD
ncbi:MAG: xylanase [Mongoliibacter sp.]|uniref:glycoside hydrolase n=1 Tax=Mongoliibacter sp. TaxID=2022438 RepID=UPI0012F11368|nr:glycoside hydrolase [Mongoliibacter sp.]TVP52353.1 MAG: xylanase [Mongoliibacter sp.]